MDPKRFDDIVQAFATSAVSRQQVFRRLAGLLVVAIPAFAASGGAAGCKDVGEPCKKGTQCCTGICDGKN
jgi:hypothetical protein